MANMRAFEGRLQDAFDRYLAAAPMSVDATAMASLVAASQRRSGRVAGLRERFGSTVRVVLVGVLLLLALTLAVLGAGRFLNTTLPNPSPSLTPPPSAEQPGSSSAAGTWLADIPHGLVFDGNPGSNLMALTVGGGLTASIDLVGRTSGLFQSTFATLEAGAIRLTTTTGSTGAVSIDGGQFELCQTGDEGRYQSTSSANGLLLTLDLVDDACPARAKVFARTWTRSLTVPNGGGVGVIDAFEPRFTVELPPGTYAVASSADHRTIYQDLPEFQFLSFKNPQGFLDPCDLSKGRREVEPGADAFVAYFQQLAGFTVDSVEEMTVDGFRAVRLVVHADADASCPDGRLWEWQPKAEPVDGTAWFVNPGVTDSLIIVDHPAGTVMFELLPAPNPREAEVIGSIRFLVELPTSP